MKYRSIIDRNSKDRWKILLLLHPDTCYNKIKFSEKKFNFDRRPKDLINEESNKSFVNKICTEVFQKFQIKYFKYKSKYLQLKTINKI
jgi:hypothetical protein